MSRRSSKIKAPRLARSGVLNPLHTTTEREVRFDILLSLMREDSYGLPLVLRDGFGGFLPQPPSFSEGQRRGFTFGLSAHRSCGQMDFRMTDSEKQEAFYPRLKRRGFTARMVNRTRWAFRRAARKRQRGPLTSARRKRYKQTDSAAHRMRDASNSCMLRVVLCASFMTLPALLSAQNESIKYIGPGSCAATSCHGSVKPIADSRILQNEYSTWILQDKHSRAYQALTGEVGERMARILKLDAKAEECSKCLACHGLYTAPEQRGRAFAISEGVSCENCHGPASAWLGP